MEELKMWFGDATESDYIEDKVSTPVTETKRIEPYKSLARIADALERIATVMEIESKYRYGK